MNPILTLACAFAATNPPLMRDLERISPKPEKVVTDADRERMAKAQAKRERKAGKRSADAHNKFMSLLKASRESIQKQIAREKSYTIQGLEFVMTCSACPEQYSVRVDGVQVAYVRLRDFELRVDAPDCMDTTLLDVDMQDGVNASGGCFDSEESRIYWLQMAADAVNGVKA